MESMAAAPVYAHVNTALWVGANVINVLVKAPIPHLCRRIMIQVSACILAQRDCDRPVTPLFFVNERITYTYRSPPRVYLRW